MISILFLIVRMCCSHFKNNYHTNKKLFLNFLLHFSDLRPILNFLKKKMIFIAIAFPKLQTVKDLVRPLSKKCRFRTPFESQHVKGPQTFVKSAREHFHHIISSLSGKLISKTSLLVKYETLGVVPNTLTADDKYPVWDCENLLLSIQRQLS